MVVLRTCSLRSRFDRLENTENQYDNKMFADGFFTTRLKHWPFPILETLGKFSLYLDSKARVSEL